MNGLKFSNFDRAKFDDALKMVCHFFDVKELLPDQIEAIERFLSGKDIYFSAPTGYGKSLIFQCLPMVVDLLTDEAIGSCIAVVISPLKALMLDQVSKLRRDTGVTAAAIFDGQDEEVLKSIENGEYSLVYASPESLLASDCWRNMLSSEYFREHCRILVVDEAHCIVHW